MFVLSGDCRDAINRVYTVHPGLHCPVIVLSDDYRDAINRVSTVVYPVCINRVYTVYPVVDLPRRRGCGCCVIMS